MTKKGMRAILKGTPLLKKKHQQRERLHPSSWKCLTGLNASGAGGGRVGEWCWGCCRMVGPCCLAVPDTCKDCYLPPRYSGVLPTIFFGNGVDRLPSTKLQKVDFDLFPFLTRPKKVIRLYNVQEAWGSMIGNNWGSSMASTDYASHVHDKCGIENIHEIRMHCAIHYPWSKDRLSWIVILDISGWGWSIAYLLNEANHVGISGNRDDRNVHAPKQQGSDFKTDQQDDWGVVHFCDRRFCRKHGH